MQTVQALTEVHLQRPSVVTIGVFDGVHLGHQALIDRSVAQAHAHDQAAVVVSFFPHPDLVLRQISGRYYLTPPAEKARLLAAMGVDLLVLHPFDAQVQQIRAADFVDRLQQHLNMATLLITPEFALGYRREGDLPFLSAQGQEKGFVVQAMPLLNAAGQRISSTQIRQHLEAGEVEAAARLLGRPYRLTGEVVQGQQRGRSIGFPTANLATWDQQVLPATGVYACRAFLGGERLHAVTNVGQRPTFDGQGITIEAHLLDFERDIYGQELALEFLQRLRGEQKFGSIEALSAQIAQDRDQAREILSNLPHLV